MDTNKIATENKKSNENILNILGIRIDNLCRHEILKKIEFFLTEPKFHQIATVNPEFILEAQKNTEFKHILNKSDLNVADGAGIGFAFLRYGKRLKARMAGVDLMMEILLQASERKMSVFLAAKKEGLSTWEETRDAILKIYPDLKISGTAMKPDCHCEQSEESRANIMRSFTNVQVDKYDIKKNNFDIIFVNFGAPLQEIFINSQKSDTIRLAMGVGGSFDFLTGKIKRAPVFMCRLGLEWLWRLILQPRRWKRIMRAVAIFPIKILLSIL
jgi:N-acetylglucosaminyldiphosphoundecaprenol N-acetyl-beta-D-mannosaminyltransferase